MKLCWVSDIHLDHLVEVVRVPGNLGMAHQMDENRIKQFCDRILQESPEQVVISGDISTAQNIEMHLKVLQKHLKGIPVNFVLGNHDYYRGSIGAVRAALDTDHYKGLNGSSLRYLSQMSGGVKLTEKSVLFGHDGWYDGGYSDWFKSKLIMTEYLLTADFRFQPPTLVYARLRELAQECADKLAKEGPALAAAYEHVYFATHVPPFRNNSRGPTGALSDIDWLPNMSSKLAGDALLALAGKFPKTKFTVLSGHTHTWWEERYAHNLLCLTAQADHKYLQPEISIKTLEVP